MTNDHRYWLNIARRTMEESLIEAKYAEIHPKLAVLAKGDLVLLMASEYAGQLLNLATMAVGGLDADELILVSDTTASKSEVNPEGKPWEHGERQRRFHEPAARALLMKALIAMRARRTVTGVECATIPYERHPDRIDWSEERVTEGITGRVTEVLEASVRAPWLTEIMAAKGVSAESYGLPESDAATHRKMATVRTLAARAEQAGDVVVFALPTSEDSREREIVERSLRRAGLPAEIRSVGGPRREWWRG